MICVFSTVCWCTWLSRSTILCHLLAALGHVFVLEQPSGGYFRHIPRWRYLCKYCVVVSLSVLQHFSCKLNTEGPAEWFWALPLLCEQLVDQTITRMTICLHIYIYMCVIVWDYIVNSGTYMHVSVSVSACVHYALLNCVGYAQVRCSEQRYGCVTMAASHWSVHFFGPTHPSWKS